MLGQNRGTQRHRLMKVDGDRELTWQNGDAESFDARSATNCWIVNRF
jgi:hypothetical protein